MKTKIIHFPRGSKKRYVDFIKEVNCDVISLDESADTKLMKITQEKNITIQGNLSPIVMLNGGNELKQNVIKVLEKFKESNHIFNLSHGILPQTPIQNVEKTIEIVRNYEVTK